MRKAVHTTITVLKKHAEAEPLNWDKWISYVEYSYYTRTHSTTKYSPFEILFGVQPREFLDFEIVEDITDELSLFERSKQLKKLIEEDRKQSLKNIENAQEYQ